MRTVDHGSRFISCGGVTPINAWNLDIEETRTCMDMGCRKRTSGVGPVVYGVAGERGGRGGMCCKLDFVFDLRHVHVVGGVGNGGGSGGCGSVDGDCCASRRAGENRPVERMPYCRGAVGRRAWVYSTVSF